LYKRDSADLARPRRCRFFRAGGEAVYTRRAASGVRGTTRSSMALPATGQQSSDAEQPPDLAAFGQALLPDAPRHRALRQLHAALTACDPDASLGARGQALEALAKWLRATGKVPARPDAQAGDRPQVGRLRLLVGALESFAEPRARLARVLHRVLTESTPLPLFARLGIPSDRGFWSETTDRLARRMLPEAVDERDLAYLVAHIFPAQRDAVWLSSVPHDLTARFVGVLALPAPGLASAWAPLPPAVLDSAALIATRVAAVGLSDVIRARSPHTSLGDSPFFRLPRACDALVAALQAGEPTAEAQKKLAVAIAECRKASEIVVANLERSGVSVDVVYRIELIAKSLDRLERLIELVTAPRGEQALNDAREFAVELVLARVEDRDLGAILRNNLHLMARKIIERAGETGEHYITSSRGEFAKMLASAGGGGVLTTGTTALKYIIAWGKFAPFVDGMLAAANYAGSFLTMQLLGFTLATKQPSMTAAALAGSMRQASGATDLGGLVSMIARITRSQLAAAIGNIGLVIPASFGFDYAYRTYFGRHFLDPETADYIVHSLHPTESGTIFYAALTGVLLWASSVGAGWLENWAVYRKLPEAIANHRIRRLIGSRITGWASRVFTRNISGVGGNSTLGLLLGMTPVMGKFFGLPLDVRHVTLSTGALTLAGCVLGREALTTPGYLAAMGGIAIIGSLNFGVSFALALAVALRAREVRRADRFRLLASVIVTMLRSPLQFVFPPRSDGAAPVHGPVSIPPPSRPPSRR
jgi:site-specific recombinase